jgi:hypothetical protein
MARTNEFQTQAPFVDIRTGMLTQEASRWLALRSSGEVDTLGFFASQTGAGGVDGVDAQFQPPPAALDFPAAQQSAQPTEGFPEWFQQPYTQQVGYTVGQGGTVAQAGAKTASVTLDTLCGQITMDGSALAANTTVTFSLNDSLIGANDNIILHQKSGGTAGAYLVWVDSVSAGACVIAVRNITAGSLSEAIALQFSIFRSAAS